MGPLLDLHPCFLGVPGAVLGKAPVIRIVHTDSSLNQPMCYFLVMLTETDLSLCQSQYCPQLGDNYG